MLAGGEMISSAQAFSSYTPYSIYGVGDITPEGTAFNKSMGGVGIATRNVRFINPLNPAAVTARDSLAFMIDYSFASDNKVFRQAGMTSVSNTANIGDIIISFPIYRSSAMMVGIMPYSGTGYGYINSYEGDNLISEMGDITYSATGQGAMYQLFAAAGVTFWNRLSLGAEVINYFGNTRKTYYETISDASYLGAKNGFEMVLGSTTGKFGVQYSQKLGKGYELTLGSTYKLASNLRGTVDGYRYSTGSAATDTLYHRIDTLGFGSKPGIGGEFGFGVSLKYSDKWFAEFDYTRSDWSNTLMDKVDGFAGNLIPGTSSSIFTSSVSESYRLGFEYVPNRSDFRYYFKNCAYRAGALYRTEYYKLDGHTISTMGLSLGMTLPVFRWYNGLTLGLEVGKRGTTDANLIRENYINFSVGVNIFDIWFQKPMYN